MRRRKAFYYPGNESAMWYLALFRKQREAFHICARSYVRSGY